MGNMDVSKPDNDGERELIDRAVKALEAELATKTCNKQIVSKLEDAELERDSEETCNNKQVISKLVASEDDISRHDEDKIKLVSKQDVINLIDEWNAISFYEANEHSKECYYEMRNAIIAMQPVASCLDTISRQAAIEEIRFGQSFITKIHPTGEIEHLFDKENKALEAAVERIEAMPPVTPKQRTGHWIYDRTRDWDGECKYECSECGMGSDVDYAYCMRCGAKMVEHRKAR